MKKTYNQPVVEQIEINGEETMQSVGVSIVDDEYNGGGNAPKRRGDIIE